MNQTETGKLIATLRREQGITQQALAERLHVTAQAVSKWERGIGSPDVSLLEALSKALKVPAEQLLSGSLPPQEGKTVNMKNSLFYVCPVCGNILFATGNAELACCGRKLTPLARKKAENEDKLTVEKVEDEWFVSSPHPMEKEHYISFVAFATGDRVQLVKTYPEWGLQVRFPAQGHGMLLYYCTQHGLFSQYL